MCKENKDACKMEQITENLTKSMFVLMGKLTSMAETLKVSQPKLKMTTPSK